MMLSEVTRPFLSKAESLLHRQSRSVSRSALLMEVMEAVSDGIVVLNSDRQIVFANSVFLAYAGAVRLEQILGLRPGEALGCTYARKSGECCNTSVAPCQECAALGAIIIAEQGKTSTEDCRITRRIDGQLIPLDVRVRATNFAVNQEQFTLFVLSDIAAEKQLAALERVFFHDIRNKASIIAGTVEMMDVDDRAASDPRIRQMLSQASVKLLNEIDTQEQLVAAERGELEIEPRPMSSLGLLRSVVNLYSGFGEFRYHQVLIDDQAEDFLLCSDEALLGRVLGNMIKNALEASEPDDQVTVGCLCHDNHAHFWVHNATPIPRKVQLRLFTGSFSTKGEGRGIGTYGMKLLSERYLNGHIQVCSSPSEGTTFTGIYPLDGRSHLDEASINCLRV